MRKIYDTFLSVEKKSIVLFMDLCVWKNQCQQTPKVSPESLSAIYCFKEEQVFSFFTI